MRKEKGITLVALIITIIVMLILVGVTVTVALNGRLFTTTKEAAIQTEIEKNKEILASAAWGTIGNDAKVNFGELDNNKPDKFSGNNGIYMKDNAMYIVDSFGTVDAFELPKEGYTWIEYLESTGKQYINTGVKEGNIGRIDYDMLYTTSGKYCQLGNHSSIKYGYIWGGDTYKHAIMIGDKFVATRDDLWHHYSITQNYSLGQISLSQDLNTPVYNTFTYKPTTANCDFYLFGWFKDVGVVKDSFYAKCGLFRIYDGDNNLIRCYIPALDSDERPCMYDAVTKQPFYSGTSDDFIAGPEI